MSLDDIELQMALLKAEIEREHAALTAAIRARRALEKDSPLIADADAAVVAAQQALTAIEVKMRQLYESNDKD